MTNGPQEANATNRAAAREVRDLFNALIGEGFTELQALRIIGQVIANSTKPPA